MSTPTPAPENVKAPKVSLVYWQTSEDNMKGEVCRDEVQNSLILMSLPGISGVVKSDYDEEYDRTIGQRVALSMTLRADEFDALPIGEVREPDGTRYKRLNFTMPYWEGSTPKAVEINFTRELSEEEYAAMDEFYKDSPLHQAVNQIVEEAVEELVRERDANA